MALSPLSPSAFTSTSSVRAPSAERLSPTTSGVADVQSPQRSIAVQQWLKADGFDSPAGLQKVSSGLQEVAQVFERMAQLLDMSVRALGGVGGGVGAQGTSAPGAPVGGAAQGVTAPASVNKGSASNTGNTITFNNDGTSPMTIAFTPNAGEKPVDSVTLQPGESKTVEFSQGWSGNFRSTTGDGAAATLGEVKFNGGDNQTYYDVSYIEGDNASMTIQPESGGRVSGSMDNLLASAPDSIKARDAKGEVYGIKKTTTSNVLDQEVVDFYRKHVGADEGYVIPTDDASTLATRDTNLVVNLKNLF